MEDPTSIQTETSEMDAQLLASRQQLKESKDRLLTVSDYCETEYLKNRDHIRNAKIALDQTKNYTTQSLASVAYQINTLATTFLSILQMQTAQLNMLETSINQVSQKVDLYQEKVARRDIGKLANKKSSQRGICVRKLMGNEMVMHKDLGIEYAQQVTVRQHKYIRRGIDFNALDNLGQGSYPKMKSLRLHNNANNLTNPMNNNMNQLTSTLQRSNQQVHSLQHQQNMMHAQQKQVLMQQQHLMMQQQQRGNSNSQSSGSNYSAMQVQTSNHHNITATSLHSSGSRSSNLQNTRNVGLPEISKTQTISDNKNNNIPSPPILAPPPPIFQQNNSTPSSGQQPVLACGFLQKLQFFLISMTEYSRNLTHFFRA